MSTNPRSEHRLNPWVDLPYAAPFIAPVDADAVTRLEGGNGGDTALRLDLLPQPWTGRPADATVIVLALNPGFSPSDYDELQNPDYAEQWRLALTFQTRTPFYFLDPAFSHTGGYRWWARRFRDLIAVVGIESVARRVMCIEHFPYKSKSYRSLKETLPSQHYSFDLVREAIRLGKEIVVMRSERVWLESVPELRGSGYVRLSNHQNPYFSRAQMAPASFERLVAALKS
jgi:hypothetical protein